MSVTFCILSPSSLVILTKGDYDMDRKQTKKNPRGQTKGMSEQSTALSPRAESETEM